MDIHEIERELKKRVNTFPVTPWRRRQNDSDDEATKFIYRTPGWDDLVQRLAWMPPEISNYAINRWFNYWSAVGVEQIFCSLPGVVPAPNPKDRLVDFTIQGVRFDHKTTVFPSRYTNGPFYAVDHPESLIEWLYQNQSQQQRKHLGNRLFLVLIDWQRGEHWKLRAELSLMRGAIEAYVQAFDQSRLKQVRLNKSAAMSDVIWITT